jgi:hypothetical protein
MRKVEIRDEPSAQRRWIAVDKKSREVILRLHDEDLLLNICRSLGWEIVQAQDPRSTGYLSDKNSRLHPRHVVPKPAQAYEPEVPVKVRERISTLSPSGEA